MIHKIYANNYRHTCMYIRMNINCPKNSVSLIAKIVKKPKMTYRGWSTDLWKKIIEMRDTNFAAITNYFLSKKI